MSSFDPAEVFAKESRRTELHKELQRFQHHLMARWERVARALQTVHQLVPTGGTPYAITSEKREDLANALVMLCEVARSNGFGKGVELIVQKDSKEQSDSMRIVIHLFKLAERGERENLIQLLLRTDELPAQPDELAASCASQSEIWRTMILELGTIIPYPWAWRILPPYLDLSEGFRLQRELSGLKRGDEQTSSKTNSGPSGEGVVSAVTEDPSVMSAASKRFLIGLSFPGEYRPFVANVAVSLAKQVGRDRVLYDEYYEAEFARPDLDTHLQGLYRNETELIVIFLCADYERKRWCKLEWRAIRELIGTKDSSAIMLTRFDRTEIQGIFAGDGYVEVKNREPTEIAQLILERLRLRLSEIGSQPKLPQVPTAASDLGTPRGQLSDFQIGYIGRLLKQFLLFIPGPAPMGGPEVRRQWCQNVCGVDTIHEVGERWAGCVKDLGATLFAMNLADKLRQQRPDKPGDLLMTKLKTVAEFAHAILCLAIDEAESEEIFRRARRAAQLKQPFPEQESERAAGLSIDAWQIGDVLSNTLLMDQERFQAFLGAFRERLESLLPELRTQKESA